MAYAGAPNDLIPGVCFSFDGIANLILKAAASGVVHRAVAALGQSGAIHLLTVVQSVLADRLSP